MTSLIRYAQICEALTTARCASISESNFRSDAAMGAVVGTPEGAGAVVAPSETPTTAPSAPTSSTPVMRAVPSVVLSASQRSMASARHSGRVEERYVLEKPFGRLGMQVLNTAPPSPHRYVLEKPFGRDHASCCEVREGH